MAYFNYHATAKKLIKDGKLANYSFVQEYHGVKPALLLFFNDEKHPVVIIREHKFLEYALLIDEYFKNKTSPP